jgi:predicted ABC-type ATPase
VILVYIQLSMLDLNEARVRQRVSEDSHEVSPDKIRERLPKTVKNVKCILPLVNEAHILDNSLKDNPFRHIAVVRSGRKQILTGMSLVGRKSC